MSDDKSEVDIKPLNGIIGKLDNDWSIYIIYSSTNLKENINIKIIIIYFIDLGYLNSLNYLNDLFNI